MERRELLKGLGGVAGVSAIGGIGMLASTGGAAAMTSSFTAGSATVRNDRGDVSEVYVAPKVRTEWSGFDERPRKIRHVLEAGVAGTGFKPVFRETPYLMDENDNPTHGTSDDWGTNRLLSNNSDFYEIGSSGNVNGTYKIVLYKEGMSDYYGEASDYPDEAHWTGASLGDDSGDYANGNYGVLGDTSALDEDDDGETTATDIELRLTTVLLNGDSETVMQDEYPAYETGNYTYEWLQNNADNHPAINVARATFTVTADNIAAESGTNANANGSAN